MDQPGDVIDITAIARKQQLRNAQVLSLALALLSSVGAIVTSFSGHPPLMTLVVFGPVLGMGFAYLLARRGYLEGSALLLVVSLYVQHPTAVWMQGTLGATPFAASVVIFLATATSPARYLVFAFLGCLGTLAVEAALVPLAPGDPGLLGTAALLAAMSFVVSLLHARGVERAFALAQEQSRARVASTREALDSERRFRLLAETADDLIAILKPTGETVFLSDSHERLFGVPLPKLSQGRFSDHLEVEDLEQIRKTFSQALRDGQGRFEMAVLTPSKGRILLDVRVRPIEWQSNVLVAVISRDITEQRTLQERLHASERLEALGRLAGSVAHDFNNLLTVIEGSADIAISKLPDDSSAVEDLDAVMSASQMAAELARQLLTFSRREMVIRTPTNVGQVLLEHKPILARLLGPEIRLELALAQDLPKVTIPEAHVQQLAMNFAANARDAMPQGGVFSISTSLRHLRDREVADLLAGEYVELQVSDDGSGIAPDVIPRLFEPFFSTKGKRGTGLGLATCQSIAVGAGGLVTVSSGVGRGTSFRVLLPVAERSRAPVSERHVEQQSALKHVLVVDDDPDVRSLVTRMLAAEGFEVRALASATEALEVLADQHVPLDALLTDVVLGAESGTDLLLKCRALRPRLRILVMSGYTPDPEAALVLEQSDAGFLAKPFGRDKLRAALLNQA